MSIRDSIIKPRCKSCFVHKEDCFCKKISSLSLATKVSIIIYKKEMTLPSNTAHLALKSLSNTQYFERGHKDTQIEESFIDHESYQPLFLYPSDDAKELTPKFLESFNKPINLIVPDGTWRQAKKVYRREKLLDSIPQVKLSLSEKTKYLLRRQKSEFGLCTFEAIAYALRVIEGKAVSDDLMKNFDIFQVAHLVTRDIFAKEKKKMGYS